jgi:hypothetical protein
MALAANTTQPQPADAPEGARPSTAIVGGHRIQPRANSPDGAPDATGISKNDAEEVDRLYQELMRQAAPGTDPSKGSPAPK